MKSYVDYNYYKDTFKGTIIPSNSFDNYSMKASIKLNYFTSNKIKTITDDIKYTTCLIAEFLYEQEQLKNKILNSNDSEVQKASETVGPHSVTYVNYSQYQDKQIKTDKEVNKVIYQLCKENIIDVNLLFRGV